MSRNSFSFDDPFERFLRAPSGETPEARATRIAEEEDARRINAEIEEQLKAERASARKQRASEVKLLLLGQESSGKTTTLKQFLLNFSSNIFHSERGMWRPVIFLNVITSYKLMVEALANEEAFDLRVDGRNTSLPEIKMRLLPVLHLEEELVKRMSNDAGTAGSKIIASWPKGVEEVAVYGKSYVRPLAIHTHDAEPSGVDGIPFDTREDPSVILNASRNEMFSLWTNPRVRDILKKQKIRLEESGFFLEDLERITARRYVPTDEDILRARIKTVGASEHIFKKVEKTLGDRDMVWRIYDVGGARTQRQTWVPFFDDMDAIIFLAPISSFDQTLAEDKKTNRLEDSMQMWTELCKNKILANVPLIAFLNKCDLLKSKLESGVQIKKYVPSYGDRTNDFATASQYFLTKFENIRKTHTVNPKRDVFIHLTSMTSRDTMDSIICNVRDVITRLHLRDANFLV